MTRPLIIDSFAGGGGASTGIEMALGRSPDYAINHSADALAMHEVNHPDTVHLSKNIWQVDPLDVVGSRPVGLAWFSPDCKHFSKAKGGRPVKRNIRDLAWTVVLWAKRARPAVIILENVEEFQDWGPLIERAPSVFVPCPDRRGETFRQWIRELKRLGYKVEWRELRACDYGAPTIRKRLFLIARRDGKPIVWPEPTHGKPDDPDVIAGRKLPWRTAAEIIDWSLPCPSIFDTSEGIKAKHGVRAIRPLADATMRRIARGIVRYVLEAKRPFLVSVAHGDSGGRREYPLDEPTGTQTSAGNAHAVVAPSFIGCGGRAGQSAPQGGDQPLGTQTAKADGCLVAAHLTSYYGEGKGGDVRGSSPSNPLPTDTAGGNRHGLVTAFLAQHNNDTKPNGRDFTRAGRSVEEPIPTVTTAPQQTVVSAFLAQHNTGVVGHDVRKPLSTMTTGGSYGLSQQAVVAAHMMRQFGQGEGHDLDEPTRTDTAGVNKSALISAFLTKYYGTGDGARVTDPMHTDTTKDRMGLVTLEIDGVTYAIADIGMRMLTPRERFRAQGFPDDYIIDRRPDGSPISATVQGSCCGNSVPPVMARALAGANCADLAIQPIMEAAE